MSETASSRSLGNVLESKVDYHLESGDDQDGQDLLAVAGLVIEGSPPHIVIQVLDPMDAKGVRVTDVELGDELLTIESVLPLVRDAEGRGVVTPMASGLLQLTLKRLRDSELGSKPYRVIVQDKNGAIAPVKRGKGALMKDPETHHERHGHREHTRHDAQQGHRNAPPTPLPMNRAEISSVLPAPMPNLCESKPSFCAATLPPPPLLRGPDLFATRTFPNAQSSRFPLDKTLHGDKDEKIYYDFDPLQVYFSPTMVHHNEDGIKEPGGVIQDGDQEGFDQNTVRKHGKSEKELSLTECIESDQLQLGTNPSPSLLVHGSDSVASTEPLNSSLSTAAVYIRCELTSTTDVLMGELSPRPTTSPKPPCVMPELPDTLAPPYNQFHLIKGVQSSSPSPSPRTLRVTPVLNMMSRKTVDLHLVQGSSLEYHRASPASREKLILDIPSPPSCSSSAHQKATEGYSPWSGVSSSTVNSVWSPPSQPSSKAKAENRNSRLISTYEVLSSPSRADKSISSPPNLSGEEQPSPASALPSRHHWTVTPSPVVIAASPLKGFESGETFRRIYL